MRQFLTRIIKNDRIFDYANPIFAGFIVVVLMRIVETSMIAYNYRLDSLTALSELGGLAHDILFTGALFVVFYPVYYFTGPHNKKSIKLLFILIAGVLCIIHFVILNYFLYQLIPLDIFMYQYSVKEILYTLKTSDINLSANLLLLTFIISLIIITVNFVVKQSLNLKIKKGLLIITIFSLPLYILLHIFFNGSLNKYSQNKTVFFFTESFKFFSKTEKRDAYSRRSSINQIPSPKTSELPGLMVIRQGISLLYFSLIIPSRDFAGRDVKSNSSESARRVKNVSGD